MAKPIYFRGQGILKLAEYDPLTDVLGGFRKVGNVPMLKVSPSVTKLEHEEDQSGLNLVDGTWYLSPKLAISFDLEAYNASNISLALWGNKTVNTASSFTNRAVDHVAAGFDYEFGRPGAVIVSMTDSASTAITADKYTVNTDGTFTFTGDLTALVMPLKLSGTESANTTIGVMSDNKKEVALIFAGLNAADGNRPATIKIPRISMSPTKDMEWVSKTLQKLALEGTAIYDPSNPMVGVTAGYAGITFG